MVKRIGDLAGRTAMVTGAGQGVGAAIARAMAAHGAEGIVVNDYVAERAEAVAAEIEASGGRAIAVAGDVSDLASVREAVARGEEAFGRIDVLINNAGNAGPAGFDAAWPVFWETEPEDWGKYFAVNLFGAMNCCHAVMPGMAQRGHGRIVTIVSDAGRLGEPRMAAYSAAKAGAAGFARSLAREAARHSVTVNTVSLGTIAPDLPEAEKQAFISSERTRKQLERYAIRRLGEPEDAAAMCVFLASDAASWITGQTIPVNGGYSFAQ